MESSETFQYKVLSAGQEFLIMADEVEFGGNGLYFRLHNETIAYFRDYSSWQRLGMPEFPTK